MKFSGIQVNAEFRGPWDIPDSRIAIVRGAEEKYGIPAFMMVAISLLESSMRSEALNPNGEYSVGPFQFNMRAWNYPEEQLRDLTFASNLAGDVIRRNYDKSGDWYQAMHDWSVRPWVGPLVEQWNRDGTLSGGSPVPINIPAPVPPPGGGRIPGSSPSPGAGSGWTIPGTPVTQPIGLSQHLIPILALLGVMGVAYIASSNAESSWR